MRKIVVDRFPRNGCSDMIEWMLGPGNYVNTRWMQSLPDQEEFMSVVKSDLDVARIASMIIIVDSPEEWLLWAMCTQTRFFQELDNPCRNDKNFVIKSSPFRSEMFVACFDEAVKQQIRFWGEAAGVVRLEKVTQTCDALSKSDDCVYSELFSSQKCFEVAKSDKWLAEDWGQEC